MDDCELHQLAKGIHVSHIPRGEGRLHDLHVLLRHRPPSIPAALPVRGADIVDGTITGADVGNGTLKDEDIAQAAFPNFDATVGSVPAHTCVGRTISGINNQGDHMLITPSGGDYNGALIYNVGPAADNNAALWACNPTNATIEDGNTHFNLLLIDAG